MLEQYNEIVTVNDVCNVLKVGRNRVYELLHSNELHGFRLGRNWKITRLSLEEYLMKHSASIS